MKQAVIRGLPDAVLARPSHRQDQSPREFEGERELQDRQHKARESLHGLHIQSLLQGQSLVQAELTTQRQSDHGRDRHVAEAAELNQRQDHQLSECGEIVWCIDNDQSRDAHR